MTNEKFYFVPLTTNNLVIPWAEKGAEWEHHLMTDMRIQVNATGSRAEYKGPTSAVPFHHYEFSIISDDLNSTLIAIITTQSIYLYVKVSELSSLSEQVLLWKHAMATATKKLDSQRQSFEWQACIAGQGHQALEQGLEFGPLTLKSTGKVFKEALSDFQPSMNSTIRVDWCYPVKVLCTTPGYAWQDVQVEATRLLYRACGILSVATGERWIIKNSPVPRELDIPLSKHYAEFSDNDKDTLQRRGITLPDWIHEAWDKINLDPMVSEALVTYQEGLELSDRHPSYAYAAFVAVVERIGGKYCSLKRCECCEECRCTVGAGKRFRKGLHLVRSRKQAKVLGKGYDTWRSPTAHYGILHGSEAAPGSFFIPSVFQERSAATFSFHALSPMRSVAEDLLRKALKGELPVTLNDS